MRRLGDILIEQQRLTQAQLEEAFASKPRDIMLGDWLVQRKLLNTQQLGEALAEQFMVPYLDVDPASVDLQVARLLPEDFARSQAAGAISVEGREMTLAMVAPDNIETIAEAELMTGYRIRPVVALGDAIEALISRVYDDRAFARQTIVDMKFAELEEARLSGEADLNAVVVAEQEDAPVVRLVQAILAGAVTAGASDIHLEPHKPEMRVRYRVDGELQQVMTIPNHIESPVISRIKVMGDMDTTENRRPQDGHLTVFENGKRVGFRVSCIPTVDGQKLVLRLLDEGGQTFDLAGIGLPDADYQTLSQIIDKPHGMLVVTGPTGSGKSTTLYAVLEYLNCEDRNIVTVEDPVEFRLPGINQVQSDNEFGMGFANALKFIMRQDPDVIMLGEIRDSETATTAIQAALTGHLVISTLHTNDAVGAVQRLADLGVDNFKIAGSLLGSVAQRLLRRICDNCKCEVQANENLLRALDPEGTIDLARPFYRGRGCNKCLGTGFSGRLPIFEIMPVNPEIMSAVEAGVPHSRLRELAVRHGMVELYRAGLQQAIAGTTSLEEVYFKTAGDRRSEQQESMEAGRRETDRLATV
ncbi:GspE/PulE family protein [Crateriforma conspicua]|uniref:Type II secretion system protein E n=1 Tax=Crateriforma conspicua TaxID=2527996 RepID=A0A5C5YA71_9PLAN|nr:ATPase, T2SS/T4P/T4SS family [Crateriforma conspicua]QDV61164.1 Type II secretion system protein E [Crateriforma conspicua]TWT72586.1 Type II secretion system protein E [Crateriforma conspicua]